MALFARKSKSSNDENAPLAMPTAPNAANGTSASGSSGNGSSVMTAPTESNGVDTLSDDMNAGVDASNGRGKRKARAPKAARSGANSSGRSTARGIKGGVVVGLNIGSDSIKAIEVRGKGSEAVVTALGMIPTPTESLSNGVVMSPAALSSAIRELFTQSGIRSHNVITSIAGSGSLVVRVLEVPKMSDQELADNMKMDLERYVPFPPTDVVKDFRALRELPSDPDAPNMEVLLVAVQNETVDLHLKVLQSAKLEPQAIDVEPLAAARTLFYNADNGGDSVQGAASDFNDATALINIGATGTEISVLRGDVLVFTRSVPVAGNAMTQAIADNLGLTWPDAERTKRELGDALPPHQDSAAPAAAPDDDWSAFGEDTLDNSTATVNSAVLPVAAPSAPVAESAIEAPVEDDPFGTDFFNQGPRTDEPQQGHQQKQDGEKPFEFDLSRFNFSDDEVIEVDETIPTDPQAEENLRRRAKTGFGENAPMQDAAAPIYADAATMADEDNSNLPAMASEEEVADSASDVRENQNLPSMLDFSMAGEDEGLTSMAPSGQMYGAGSADDLELPSFPTLPVFPDALLAPGSENYNEGVEDMLPTMVDEGDSSTQSGGETSNLPTMDSETSATTPANARGATVSNATVSDETAPSSASGIATPIFDFAAPVVAGTSSANGSDFENAFASMIAEPTPPSNVTDAIVPAAATPVITPGTATSAYDTASAGDDGFDLDQFATPTTADDSFTLDDFGMSMGGDESATPASIYTILQPRLEELTNEVRRSLEYYASRYPDAGVRRIVLVGGGARLANMDVLLTQEIGIPTTVYNPLGRVTLQANGLSAGFVDENGSAFAVALGLALRDLVA